MSSANCFFLPSSKSLNDGEIGADKGLIEAASALEGGVDHAFRPLQLRLFFNRIGRGREERLVKQLYVGRCFSKLIAGGLKNFWRDCFQKLGCADVVRVRA